MADNITLSIVTPSYNQAQYLEDAILSVLTHNLPNIEYIIMDGGSQDGSVEIIKKYAHRLAHWESKPDEGQADAINRGFEISRGNILAWLNSDDRYEPGALQQVLNVFKGQPQTQLVYGEGWYIDRTGNRIRPCRFIRKNFTRTYLVNKDPILQQSAFWTRELWERAGPLNTNLNWVFDWDWFIRAYQHTKFTYLPEFISSYRVHEGAKTRSSDIRRLAEVASITRKYGAWWHPNWIVQRARILEAFIDQNTRSWPSWLRMLARLLPTGVRMVSEQLLYGRYSFQ